MQSTVDLLNTAEIHEGITKELSHLVESQNAFQLATSLAALSVLLGQHPASLPPELSKSLPAVLRLVAHEDASVQVITGLWQTRHCAEKCAGIPGGSLSL